MALMTEKHIRHLPVLENGCLVGIISIGDLTKRVGRSAVSMCAHRYTAGHGRTVTRALSSETRVMRAECWQGASDAEADCRNSILPKGSRPLGLSAEDTVRRLDIPQ